MLLQFSLVLVFLLIAVIFVFGSLFAGQFFRPKEPNPVKEEVYECGEKTLSPSWFNFNIRFYLLALIFVIFDVEVALIFPVVAVYKEWISKGAGILAFFEIFLFVFILFAGLLYLWAKRDLEWVKRW